MIKNFECFHKLDKINVNGLLAVQWEKTDEDGHSARVWIAENATRQVVRNAFEAVEIGLDITLFDKEDSKHFLCYATEEEKEEMERF